MTKKKWRPIRPLIGLMLFALLAVPWCSYQALRAHVRMSEARLDYPRWSHSMRVARDQAQMWRNAYAGMAAVLLLLEGGGVWLCFKWDRQNRRLKVICPHCKHHIPYNTRGGCRVCGEAVPESPK